MLLFLCIALCYEWPITQDQQLILSLLGVTLVYTHSYEIYECVINKGTSGEEKAASRTQIMKEEEFLLLDKLKTECCNTTSDGTAEHEYFTRWDSVHKKCNVTATR